VAGYDLMRLLCGSWGSLALITEVTLRVQPIRPAHAGLLLTGALADLERFRAALLLSTLTPERCDWQCSGNGSWALRLVLSSVSDQAVQDQLNRIQSLADRAWAASRSQTMRIATRCGDAVPQAIPGTAPRAPGSKHASTDHQRGHGLTQGLVLGAGSRSRLRRWLVQRRRTGLPNRSPTPPSGIPRGTADGAGANQRSTIGGLEGYTSSAGD
jgi:hypothetical protein